MEAAEEGVGADFGLGGVAEAGLRARGGVAEGAQGAQRAVPPESAKADEDSGACHELDLTLHEGQAVVAL